MLLSRLAAPVLAAAALAAAAAPPPIGPNEAVIFSDHFDGPGINMSIWKHELTLSGEGSAYSQRRASRGF